MKHERYFNQFLENKVNLNKSRIDTLDEKVSTITSFLKKIDTYKKYEKQGSYGMKTIIKPPKDKDFDADIMIYIEQDVDFEPKDYINQVYNLFREDSNYENIVSKETRCIKINYKGDFHLDIVPCIEINNQKLICNRNTNEYEDTDGTAYKQWLIQKNKDSHSYLKKVTKLIKYMRDIKTNFSCKSILLTTLLGNQISYSNQFTDLPTALKEIINGLNNFLQENYSIPIIKNPVLESEDFNRHWDQHKYSNFREKIALYTKKINDAYSLKDHNESVKKWREVFGDNFGELKDESNENNSSFSINNISQNNRPWSF